MPAPIDPNLKAQIRRTYASTKLTPSELASQFDVSERSIQNWIKAESWEAERKAQNVIDFSKPRERQPHSPVPTRKEIKSIDDIAAIEGAISSVYAAMTGLGSASFDHDGEIQYTVDGRSLASCATALVKLLEYRTKLIPKTAAQIADAAIAANIPPDEFMKALREAWRLRA